MGNSKLDTIVSRRLALAFTRKIHAGTGASRNRRLQAFGRSHKTGTIPYSYVKKLGAARRWCWIVATTKEALPEETLLRNFFYFYCFKYGADYRSAIRLYRRLEPMEILMKICFSEDYWLDGRDKNLRFLIKNPISKPAAAIASGVG